MNAEFIATAALRASLLMALGLAALRWLPVERPQLRRFAALACLGASLVLPFLPVLSRFAITSEFSKHVVGTFSGGADLALMASVVALIWFIGGMLAALRLLFRGLALRRWIAECAVMEPPASFSLSLPVRACHKAAAPCVAGFLRPVLIVPERARQWDEATWRCVLAHELQHVRQGDLWLGWITHAARILHWWNPLAWKLSRSAGLECEACCDEAVLRGGVKPADYARVLLRFTSTEAALPSAGLFIHGKSPSSLRLRMERLLRGGASRVSGWHAVAVVALLVTGMAGCVWLGFSRMQTSSPESALGEESALRWQANPFPGDER